MGVLIEDDRGNTVYAQTDLHTLEIPATELRQVFDDQPDVLDAFVALVQRRNRAGSTHNWA